MAGFGSRVPPAPVNLSPAGPFTDGLGRLTAAPPVNPSPPVTDRDGLGTTTPPDPSAETTPAPATVIAGTVMNPASSATITDPLTASGGIVTRLVPATFSSPDPATDSFGRRPVPRPVTTGRGGPGLPCHTPPAADNAAGLDARPARPGVSVPTGEGRISARQ